MRRAFRSSTDLGVNCKILAIHQNTGIGETIPSPPRSRLSEFHATRSRGPVLPSTLSAAYQQLPKRKTFLSINALLRTHPQRRPRAMPSAAASRADRCLIPLATVPSSLSTQAPRSLRQVLISLTACLLHRFYQPIIKTSGFIRRGPAAPGAPSPPNASKGCAGTSSLFAKY
jgi:hypothetical protein